MIISPKELRERYSCYDDMADLAISFCHRIVLETNVVKWRENKLTKHLTGRNGDCKFYTPANYVGPKHNQEYIGAVDLNSLALSAKKGGVFTLEEYMKFYMELGVSLSFYGDVFGQCEVTEYGLKYFENPPDDFDFDNGYWETPISYMIKKYKGKLANI